MPDAGKHAPRNRELPGEASSCGTQNLEKTGRRLWSRNLNIADDVRVPTLLITGIDRRRGITVRNAVGHIAVRVQGSSGQ